MLNSPLAWVGGKRKLRQAIIPLLPSHETYVEAFSGGAWVLFGKPPSQSEVLNDVDGELVNFWRVVKERPQAFIAEFRYLLVSREIFTVLKRVDVCYLSEVVRAVRFFYLYRASFGAQGGSYAVMPGKPARPNLEELDAVITEAHSRLLRVSLENLHYAKLLARYDRPGTFFYLDPPYADCPGCYVHEFQDEDHRDLAERLARLKGKWMLSYNDHPLIRKLYKGKGLVIKRLRTSYSLAKEAPQQKQVEELLIANYPLRLGG